MIEKHQPQTEDAATAVTNRRPGSRCLQSGMKRQANKSWILLPVFFILFSLVGLSFPSNGCAENLIELRSLRHWSTPEYVRIVIDLSGPVEFTKGKLSNPERLFFDLKNAKIIKGLQPSYAVNDKVLKTIRIGQFNANTARIVLDLELTDYDFKVFNLEDPSRLVIDVFSKGSDIKKPEPKTEASTIPEAAPALMQRRIVLDAGHGGHDPGAVGPSGLFEKDVVLDIALKARDIIRKEYPSYEVVLTRARDVFIELKDRAKIANRHKADIFVSIHANASPNKKTRGIETYRLNWTNNAEEMRVAARENAVAIEKMQEMKSEVGFMLASLTRGLKIESSLNLAGFIQKSLAGRITSEYPQAADLGVKQAFFFVLVGAEMPCALVEVSFISNREEEKLLSDGTYREKIAHSVVSGINTYLTSGPQQRMAASNGKPNGDYTVRPVKYSSSDRY